MKDTVTALMIGDIVGKPGLRALDEGLKGSVAAYDADVVVVNGENAADGFGLTEGIVETLLSLGVDVITSGNHIWQKRDVLPFLDRSERVLRPANYPEGCPGRGSGSFVKAGVGWTVINLQGRKSLYPIDCPFRVGRRLVDEAVARGDIVLIDFHAESTEEKEALGLYLDGAASVVVGTHTHVRTSDIRLLPKGTGYITDLGMTGPDESCIGVKIELSLGRSLTQIPLKMETAEGSATIHGAAFTIDVATRRVVELSSF